MVIKLEIKNHEQLGELIKIFGLNGYRAYRFEEEEVISWKRKQYLILDTNKGENIK